MDNPKGKPKQTQGSKTTDDVFCEMICMLLGTIKDDSHQGCLKLDNQRLVITAIDQNNTVTYPVAVMSINNNEKNPQCH